VQTRVFVRPEQFSSAVAHYKALTGGTCSLHFPFQERGLELAAVSGPVASFLIIAGAEDRLAPFRATSLTILVEDIEAVAPTLLPLGGEILQPVTPVPTGYQTRARHPGGLVVEYVQHTEAADRFRITAL
jgi:predicted enzyme related to lactoylglutathione lyase